MGLNNEDVPARITAEWGQGVGLPLPKDLRSLGVMVRMLSLVFYIEQYCSIDIDICCSTLRSIARVFSLMAMCWLCVVNAL